MSKLCGNFPLPFPLIAGMDAVRGALAGALMNLPQQMLQLIRGSLRAKFILLIVSLEIVLMGAVAFVVEGHQRRAILEQTRLRAVSLGSSLAALSEGYLLRYNFVKLEQTSENVPINEADVVYTIAHLGDGKVDAFSGRNDIQAKTLDDPISQHALAADTPLVQHILIPQTKEPGYDVAIPVYTSGSPRKWGTIRLGFSLKHAYERIRRTRRDLALLGLASIFCGTSLAVFLAHGLATVPSLLGQLLYDMAELLLTEMDGRRSVFQLFIGIARQFAVGSILLQVTAVRTDHRDGVVRGRDDPVIEGQLLFGLLALGDVVGNDQAPGSSAQGKVVVDDLEMDDRPILPAVSRHPLLHRQPR
jgi:hypothetical protein